MSTSPCALFAHHIHTDSSCSLQATGDAISDKTKEKKHDASAEANKQAATH